MPANPAKAQRGAGEALREEAVRLATALRVEGVDAWDATALYPRLFDFSVAAYELKREADSHGVPDMSDPTLPEIDAASRAELARLCEAATAGPWETRPLGSTHLLDGPRTEVDLRLCAASRTAVPALLASLSRAEAERDAARADEAAFEVRIETLKGMVASAERNAAAKIAAVCDGLRASEAIIEAQRKRLDRAWAFTLVDGTEIALVAESGAWCVQSPRSVEAYYDSLDAAFSAALAAGAGAGDAGERDGGGA